MDSTVHGILQNTGVGSLLLLQGNLPNPGIEPRSPTLQADSLPTELSGKPSIKEKRGIHSTVWPLLLLAKIAYCTGFWFIMSHDIMTKAQARKNSVRKPCRSNCRCGACSAISTDFQPKLWALLCPSPFLYFLLRTAGYAVANITSLQCPLKLPVSFHIICNRF